MNKKQFDKIYERMMQREDKKKKEIQNEIDKKKDDDLIGCTFKPQTNHTKGVKMLGVSVPRLNSRDFDEVEKEKTNKSVGKKGKGEQKFLARLEEMKKRDEERKERTRRKYEQKKKKEFAEMCTFQPNKIRKKANKLKRSSKRTSIREIEMVPSELVGESHHRMESENVVGKEEGKRSDWKGYRNCWHRIRTKKRRRKRKKVGKRKRRETRFWRE